VFNCDENIYLLPRLKLRFAHLKKCLGHPFVPHTDLVLEPLSAYSVHTYVGSDKHAIKFDAELSFLLLDLGWGGGEENSKAIRG